MASNIPLKNHKPSAPLETGRASFSIRATGLQHARPFVLFG